ncbi:MAG TPA: DUF4331 domain-containing protein [Solimonas sp.]|nr:DUF4331 domain-containing protein [Solimonas sp.]
MLAFKPLSLAVAALCGLTALVAQASSHREAPFITTAPKVDGTDFYMFNSYEAGRTGTVTLIANYLPLQDAYGGPNYFSLDPNALYEIHIDNSGDALEDLSFQFRFTNQLKGLAVNANGKMVPVPLANIGAISAADNSAQNVLESYTLDVVRGDRRTGMRMPVLRKSDGARSLPKPIDNIGNKSIANYPAYANAFIHTVSIPGCTGDARVFVGQRREGFVVNLGETFDLVNIAAPVEELGGGEGARSAELNTIGDKNVTSLALEIPVSCLTRDANSPVIGGWTTASLRQARVVNPTPQQVIAGGPSTNTGASLEGGAWTQVSRLGSPLVNEVVIGLPDKDLFNATEPKDDAARFADYVTNPSLPELLEILFGAAGVRAPNVVRTDLVAAFLTGIDGLTKVGNSNTVPSEMLRLNTAVAATAPAQQKDLGVLAGDNAGFPNGRRPIDDVVDIALRAAMGVLLPANVDPESAQSRQLKYTDGARPNPADYLTAFPYLAAPIPGSPSSAQLAAARN